MLENILCAFMFLSLSFTDISRALGFTLPCSQSCDLLKLYIKGRIT